MTVTIDSLPAELRKQISLLVLDHSWHDLSALSQASRTWHNVAAPQLYMDLRIKFHDLTSLQHDVSEFYTDGLGRQYLRYARKLDLLCLAKPTWINTQKAKDLWKQKNWYNEFISFKPRAAEDGFLSGILTEFHDKDLLFLRAFNYVVVNTFPTVILKALQQFHPTCRLNIWTSQCPSIDIDGLGRSCKLVRKEARRPFDLRILRAPTLHTLKVVYTMGLHPREWRWIHLDEPMPLIFTAPNLKHLIIDDKREGRDNPIEIVKEEWEDFISFYSKLVPVAPATYSLESLSFRSDGAGLAQEQILLRVSTITDLSRLRSLEIGVYSEPELLAQVAARLTGLERLYIKMVPRSNGVRRGVAPDREEMIAAVRAFRPLKYLRLISLRSFSSLDRIVSHHGRALKGLSLEASYRQRQQPDDEGHKYPVNDGEQLRYLARLCPELEELHLPLLRTGGDARECDLYRAIGQWSHLRQVVLDLDCDPRVAGVADERDVLGDLTCLREILHNAAIDEALAAGIFKLMCSGQANESLKQVRVNLLSLGIIFPQSLVNVLRQISQSFLVTRPGLPPTAELQVQAVGTVAWQLWHEWILVDDPSMRTPPPVQQILEEWWPLNSDRNRSKSWEEIPLLVKSFPLEAGIERDSDARDNRGSSIGDASS
ncbi:uncharacterized protein BO72DRAFT_492924 [Aspergillus fijiensis CBS 313.89]|uniref:F-box domain-containing protein n=1 Tax=Aspergillus fijiensis CBS 313.89 TaxID=1448319 RepID=A0A8G1W2R6_9EURO|nr:uncharacterized protein BO72DRAFT_492924 [Aspergillus fijiensis CBS 313.89]RAK80943.1 hypothetical protein BO72DRAFT_492924 [Aspergillus fijiensis CBS 313.89]